MVSSKEQRKRLEEKDAVLKVVAEEWEKGYSGVLIHMRDLPMLLAKEGMQNKEMDSNV